MKLGVEAIKKAILHREPIVRQVAADYFARSFSRDPTVMPLVAQAIQTYGWEHAFQFYHDPANLVQSEETFLLFVQELERVSSDANDADHCWQVSRFITEADTDLLLRHQTRVMAIAALDPKSRNCIEDRLQLRTIDTQTCWRLLEEFCEQGKDKRYVNEVDLAHAGRIAESVARDQTCAGQILSMLARRIDNYEHNPMGWMEGLAAQAAGHMRLDTAVPQLVAKLHVDGEWVNEECAEALTRIGTDAVVGAIAKDFSAAPWEFRLYASGALENMRCEAVVPKCLDLFAKEEDDVVQTNLVAAVLDNFDPAGIEPARRLTLEGSNELRHQLVGVATLLGVAIPELPQWIEEERQVGQRITGMTEGWHRSDSEADTDPASHELSPEFMDLDEEPIDLDATWAPERFVETPAIVANKTGRNDPCPCGSGKKYKKCCMDKERDI